MHILEMNQHELRNVARNDLKAAFGGLAPEGLIDWDDIGISPIKELDGKAFAQLSHEQRRSVIDRLHDIGMLPVYEGNTPQQRDQMHKAISPQVRTAKWRFVLALVNEAYDLGYDYVDLEMLSPLCAQLATIERGATNPHMASTHKLRHNPAVHSIHVAGLMTEVFKDMREQNPDMSEADAKQLRVLERQLSRAALVHDMGELKGELSVASSRRGMSAAEMEAFEHNRGLTETEVFTQALDQREVSLSKVQWPAQLLRDRKDSLLNDYSVAEGSAVFEGRLHKLVERMQSQQDYLRFERKSMAPPLRTVVQGNGYHKDFMRGYALEPMEGTANGVKNKADLAELAQGFENPQLAEKLVAAVQGRLEVLQKEIESRLEYRPRSFAERITEGVRLSNQKGAER